MASSDPLSYPVTPLTAADIDQAGALVAEAGWNQVAADWHLFLDLGAVHAVRTPEGRVIATAATLPFGGQFAWISMVLVAGDYRRRGLATRLLRLCIDELTTARLVSGLDATPAGREVYRQLGFQDAWGISLLQSASSRPTGLERTPTGVAVRPMTNDDLPALAAYDNAAFGADRVAVLQRLRARLPKGAWIAERAGRIVGYLLARNGRRATQLGPLVAEYGDIAVALVAPALRAIDGPIYIDMADAKNDLRTWLETAGFTVQRSWTRMLLGRNTSFDDVARVFAIAGPELG